MASEPSAAQALYGHLKSTERPTQPRPNNSLAEAMYSALVPKPPPPSSPDRDSLLRHLRQLNARIDARLKREGKR
jgi:hypothetical protein